MLTIRLTSFDQIATGLSLRSERSETVTRYRRLYENQRRQAPQEFPDRESWLQVNLYRRITTFWGDGLWSHDQDGIPDEWIDVLSRASIERSLGGYGVIVVDADRTLRVIDTGCWIPVTDRTDAERWIGHVVVWFWHSQAKPNDPQAVADRVDILQFGKDRNVRQSWKLNGDKLGEMISETTTNVRGVVVFGNGTSDYTDVESILTQLEYRANRLRYVIDWHGQPALQGPLFGNQDRGKKAESGAKLRAGAETRAARQMSAQRRGGAFYGRNREDPEYSYLSFDGKSSDAQWLSGWLVQQLHAATAIPADGLGLPDAHPEYGSGVSRERRLFPAIQRLRALRREVTPAIRELGSLTERPVEQVAWTDSPFGGFSERAATFAELVKQGVQTGPQAAAALGLEIPPAMRSMGQ